MEGFTEDTQETYILLRPWTRSGPRNQSRQHPTSATITSLARKEGLLNHRQDFRSKKSIMLGSESDQNMKGEHCLILDEPLLHNWMDTRR